MNLKKVLSPETISLSLSGSTKEEVIEEMVGLLMKSGRIKDLKDRDAAIKAVMDREHKMSTGMQNGIAIPHGKTDVVASLVAALGVKKEGIDFGALDGKPSIIFVMTISPDNRTGPHIQFLAEVSRHLNDVRIRERILQAASPDEVIEALSG
ncbi:MAG: PTS sucrose transporter subunit IIABC [Lentisphaerae bacterium GWF2_57_35]|nr:MAG: PTS sucrose transporter subunit IIABC [Lentisphaerae bacterium GWF2_57_35]